MCTLIRLCGVDGRVRAWDVAAATPRLLDTVPFNSGGAGAKLRRVTAMQVQTLHPDCIIATQASSGICTAYACLDCVQESYRAM